jgi:tetratricopeptide (TPR) repeat protein
VLHAYWSEAVDATHLAAAVAFYQQAFELAPTRAELRADLGHVYHHHGRYEESLAQYRAALDIDPQFAGAHYGSGLAWQGLERPDLARESFQAALELVPDCGPCREALQALAE